MLIITQHSSNLFHIVIIPKYVFHNYLNRHILRTTIPHNRRTSVLVNNSGNYLTPPSPSMATRVLIKTIEHHAKYNKLVEKGDNYSYLIPEAVLARHLLQPSLIGRFFISKHTPDPVNSFAKSCWISLDLFRLPLGAGFKSFKKNFLSVLPIEERELLNHEHLVKVENTINKATLRYGSMNIRIWISRHAHIANR